MAKRQFSGAPSEICKLGVSIASNRAPLRPDCVAIFRHQSGAEPIESGEDVNLVWLASPFGFAAPHLSLRCAQR